MTSNWLLPVHQAVQDAQHQQQQPEEEQVLEQDHHTDGAEAAQLAVTVHYFPLHVCPLTDSAFVLPASSPITAARCTVDHAHQHQHLKGAKLMLFLTWPN